MIYLLFWTSALWADVCKNGLQQLTFPSPPEISSAEVSATWEDTPIIKMFRERFPYFFKLIKMYVLNNPSISDYFLNIYHAILSNELIDLEKIELAVVKQNRRGISHRLLFSWGSTIYNYSPHLRELGHDKFLIPASVLSAEKYGSLKMPDLNDHVSIKNFNEAVLQLLFPKIISKNNFSIVYNFPQSAYLDEKNNLCIDRDLYTYLSLRFVLLYGSFFYKYRIKEFERLDFLFHEKARKIMSIYSKDPEYIPFTILFPNSTLNWID